MDNGFLFSTLFSEEEIGVLEKVKGLSLVSLEIHASSVLLPPNGYVEGMGSVALTFSESNAQPLVIVFESLYKEHLEIGDRGGFKILHSFRGPWMAGQRLKSNLDVRGADVTMFRYPIPPTVSSISCFGWKGRGKLSDHGFVSSVSSSEPEGELMVDTIEFLVLEMNDFSSLILQSSGGGFYCYFEPSGSDAVDRLKRVYDDEITLQYLID